MMNEEEDPKAKNEKKKDGWLLFLESKCRNLSPMLVKAVPHPSSFFFESIFH